MENISKVLESGNSEEKIKILEDLENIDNPKFLEKISLEHRFKAIVSRENLKRVLEIIKQETEKQKNKSKFKK
mgnify:CR=1 FL=1